jgi:ABC-type uncharacterized transport system involved in gliding motility auxiliary subunit
MKEWTEAEFPDARIPVAAAIEGTFRSAFTDADTLDVARTESQETSLIVIGDGDFIVNGSGQQQQALPEDNVNLFVNAVDWLADDTGLIALRTKGITNRPLEQLEEGTKTLLKYLNVLLPVLLVIAYGLFRYQHRKKRRRMWEKSGI